MDQTLIFVTSIVGLVSVFYLKCGFKITMKPHFLYY
nr:MAG TPA: hypothetical protein [Bacteriophage sp.]